MGFVILEMRGIVFVKFYGEVDRFVVIIYCSGCCYGERSRGGWSIGSGI